MCDMCKQLAEALLYARVILDQQSEKSAGKGDRIYLARILKDGNCIDKALAAYEAQR